MKKTLSDISKELNEQSGYAGFPSLIFITDHRAQPCPEEIIDRLPSGSVVILRDYDDENRYDTGKALRYICRAKGIKFLVAGDLTLSLMLEADGVHLPEYMISDAAKIKTDHPDYFISVSCHGEEALEKAVGIGADVALLAPIFPTNTHPETLDDPTLIIGVGRLADFCNKYSIPIYALGGVNVETAELLHQTGVAGISAIRGFS